MTYYEQAKQIVRIFFEVKKLTPVVDWPTKWAKDGMMHHFHATNPAGQELIFGTDETMDIYYLVEKKKVWCRVAPPDHYTRPADM